MMKTAIITLAALGLMTTSAFATNACKEYVTPTPNNAPVLGPVVKSVVVGQSSGLDGWDGQAVSCTLLSGVKSIAPSRDADGICGPARSLVGTVPGPVFALKTFIEVVANNGDVPDIIEHRNGILIPATKWTPEVFIPTTPKLAGGC